jgi:hypothetical protein
MFDYSHCSGAKRQCWSVTIVVNPWHFSMDPDPAFFINGWQMQTKNYVFFLLLTFQRYVHISFHRWKGIKKSQHCRNQGVSYFFFCWWKDPYKIMRVLYPEGPKHTVYFHREDSVHCIPAHVEGGLAEQRTNGTAGYNHPVNQWRRQAHPASIAIIKYHLIRYPEHEVQYNAMFRIPGGLVIICPHGSESWSIINTESGITIILTDFCDILLGDPDAIF